MPPPQSTPLLWLMLILAHPQASLGAVFETKAAVTPLCPYCTVHASHCFPVNVNRVKDFDDIRKNEMMLERKAMEKAKRLQLNDNMAEHMQVGCRLDSAAVLVVETKNKTKQNKRNKQTMK